MTLYKEGSRGEMVKQIQKVVGCYTDGIWGKITTECVKAWQKAHKLTPDGIVGPATMAAMGLSAVSSAVSLPNCSGVQHRVLFLKKSKRRIDEIIVHCTATPEGRDYTVEQIRKDHTMPVKLGGRGWSDIGYHYVIYRDGTTHEGRNVDVSGAHCVDHNAHSIGISYVGGVENLPGVPYNKLKPKDTRTDAQKSEILSLLIDLRKLYPKAKIYGHRDFASKACPSFDARKEYERV